MKLAIIGGGGKMGQWLCRLLDNDDFQIVIADKDANALAVGVKSPRIEATTDSKEAVRQADIIVFSVPLDRFEDAVKETAPHIRPGRIIADLSSTKAKPVAIMHKYIKEGLILGVHPLFGPGVTSVSGQNIVLTPVTDKEKALAAEAANYIQGMGAGVKIMAPEAHDKMMAVVQGLSHFTAIAAADALAGLGDLEEMKDVSTTTFRIFLNYIDSVIGDDPELYAAIQMEHPEMADIYKALNRSVEKFAGYVKAKDTRSFVKRMKELKKWLGGNPKA
jgi:prephenate dehydrogenase